MNKFTLGVALAALALPVAASAQQLPGAIVAIVDNERILTQCTACVAANAQLQAQQAQAQARAQALGGPLQTEEQAIRALVAAIPQGQQPDAALQQRIQTFQTQQANAQRELQTLQQTLGRNVAYVRQQIGERLQPIVSQVMQ
ncbi:MAG: OmpH family outer membrane protein, partial [Sphingomonadaceae bacterium]|nr:OmpH family outer membrane protein [Sphingomonadaceae bacterium]